MILEKLKNGCSVGFYGLGMSNASLLGSLPLENCRVTLRSDKVIESADIPQTRKVDKIFCGEDACREISEDIIFFSPSVRRDRSELAEAKERGVVFSSDAELFFEENRTPTLAVTGSDGKSTTAKLIHLLLTKGGYKAKLIGNFGEPMWENLGNVCDFFVCELSSFMLKYLSPKLQAACITNITPNHLDWHKSYEEYEETKKSITKKAERVIISDDNLDIKGAFGIISISKGLKELTQKYSAEIYLTVEGGYILKNGERLIKISSIKRQEKYNLKNLMMAVAMTDGLVDFESISEVARNFEGLRHRCEIVLRKNGVEYIDSSIDSTPARTIQTLTSLNKSVVIILGGRGKGLDYRELTPALEKYAKKVIIYGENSYEIYSAIKGCSDIELTDSFYEAVRQGKKCAERIGTLLLSPASTSYDKFKNYAERGNTFRQILLEID